MMRSLIKPEKTCQDDPRLASRNRTLGTATLMHLMHGAFLVPPKRQGPGPASSSLPGRGGAARLPQRSWERERALGGPGLGKGSASQQTPAPASLAETQSHGLPWEESVVGLPSPLEGKELGRWEVADRESW